MALISLEKVRSYFRRVSDFRLAIVITLIFVIAGVFLGHSFYNTVTPAPSPGFHYLLEPSNPLSYLASWDGTDYIQIALTGYQNLFWVNWFPLYPITIHLMNYLIPSPLISALVIAWTSLIGAIYFYLKIVRKLFNLKDTTEPLRALLFFVLFPTSVFLIASFAESLLAFLALGTIYFALSKRYYLASLFALLSTATHITGVIVALFIAFVMLEDHLAYYKAAISLLISSMGLLAYMLFLYIKFHSPLYFLRSQMEYHGWVQEHNFYNLIASLRVTNVIFITLLVISIAYWWKKRKSFSFYSFMFLCIPIAGRQYGGFNRYVLMAFPIPLMMYEYLRNKHQLYTVAVITLTLLWTYFLLQYMGGYIGS